MPVIIQYVDEHRAIQELLFSLLKCDQGTTGKELITGICEAIGLDFSLCRGQGYDGAGNMAAKEPLPLFVLIIPKSCIFIVLLTSLTSV